uniref:Uncharacterized protein n=1 Tax=Siphoviridae sp. ctiOl67 TaxID=2825622 RepID=A0A8S5QJK3_9CAUD|nr:MAG TPA: hypothetical protein [Siphoviridae sp. ctiOl67]
MSRIIWHKIGVKNLRQDLNSNFLPHFQIVSF